MIRKTISFTDQHDEWMKARISSGDYASDSEYLRDLIRKDQQEYAKFVALRSAIKDGLNSGISERGVMEIMKDTEARMRANGTLPPNPES